MTYQVQFLRGLDHGFLEIVMRYIPMADKAELERYLAVLKGVKKGTYRDFGLYVLPYLPAMFRNRVALLPQTSLVDKEDVDRTADIGDKDKEKIIKSINKARSFIKHTRGFEYHKFELLCQKLQPKILAQFPKYQKLDITVSPTAFGAVGHFSFKKGEILLRPRFDRKYNEIFKLFISSLANYYLFNSQNCGPDGNWTQRQAQLEEIYDQITKGEKVVRASSLSQILQFQHCGKYAQESINFLKGINKPKKPFKDKSTNTNCLAGYLEQRSNQIVGYDEISDFLWKDNSYDKFSLYAIAKQMERVRVQIIKKGNLLYNPIHSQRGKGYLYFKP